LSIVGYKQVISSITIQISIRDSVGTLWRDRQESRGKEDTICILMQQEHPLGVTKICYSDIEIAIKIKITGNGLRC
jgi:hypothetical protein